MVTASVLGFLALIAGCDSTGVITEPVAQQSKENIIPHGIIPPSVIDNRIVFDDTDEFRVFMESIINREDSYLDSVQAAINFISLRSDTERLTEELGRDIDELEVVEDPFFATVLNPEGEFQVGDMVYKITRNYVYQVLEANADYLSSISLRNHDNTVLTQKTSHDPSVQVFEVERSSIELVNKSSSSDKRDECESEFNGRRRVKGQAWINHWRIFSSATSEIESQRKAWFRWWRTSINWVRLDMDYNLEQVVTTEAAWGRFTFVVGVTQGSYTKTKYNASEVRKTLDWNIGINRKANKIRGWISSSYSGNGTYDGVARTRSCSTYVSRQ